MRKNILIVILFTFSLSYGSFKIIKETSPGFIIKQTKYYNLFVPYQYSTKGSIKNQDYRTDEQKFTDYLVQSYGNKDIKKMRPKVFSITLIAFLLSIIYIKIKK